MQTLRQRAKVNAGTRAGGVKPGMDTSCGVRAAGTQVDCEAKGRTAGQKAPTRYHQAGRHATKATSSEIR